MDKEKLRYAILMELEKKNNDIRAENFEVTEKEFLEQVVFLDREGYITKPMYADNIVYSMALVQLKEKGERCLSDNTKFKKAYNVAKEIRDWIKL